MAESRLLPLARKHGLASLADLVARLKATAADPLSVEVVEAMTTNESFFFRDKIPFEHFRTVIMPALMAVSLLSLFVRERGPRVCRSANPILK